MKVSEMHNLTTLLRFRVGFNLSNHCTFARNHSEPQIKRNREGPKFRFRPQHPAPRPGLRPPGLSVLPLAPPPAALSFRGGARGVHSCSNARRSGSDVTLAHGPSLRLCRPSLRRRPLCWVLSRSGKFRSQGSGPRAPGSRPLFSPEPWPQPAGQKLLDALSSASSCFC